MKTKSVLVVGGGAWGSAIAQTLSHNVLEVKLYDRAKLNLNEPNPKLGITLSKNISSVTDFENLNDVAAIFLVVPSEALLSVTTKLHGKITKNTPIVICAKGLDGVANRLYSQSILQILGRDQKLAVLSGPNFAGQVARRVPSITTIACEDHKILDQLAILCTTDVFKVEKISDINGAQLLGAYKNVMALSIGFLQAKKVEHNLIARFICASVAEIKILFKYFNADQSTLLSACGIGDIYLTCTSTESRNYSFGQELAKYPTAVELMKSNDITVEGVKAVQSFYNIAQNGGMMLKIVDTLYKILYQNHIIDNMTIEKLI